MSFLNLAYLPLIVVVIGVFVFLVFKLEHAFFSWIEDHWFFKRTKFSKLSSLLYCLGFSFLVLALLDLRGPEEKVQGKSSDQKTMILIDTSASMLAEDVRPSRFKKAILLARHFTKSAIGHEVSVIVFSDNAKRIVPFTKDIDLVDARLAGLEDLALNNGGTGLSMAIQESLQFLTIQNEMRGNILIFTDGEETNDPLPLKIPEGVSVGIIGIGTLKGGTIPMRTANGIFMGNKKHDGKDVITKLDENYFKKLGGELKNYKYWIASSYSLPTQEILTFFGKMFRIQESKDNFRIRPVEAKWIMIPGLLMLLGAMFLRLFKSFSFLVVIFISSNFYSAQALEEKKEPEKTPLILELEDKFKKNNLDFNGKRKLADELLKNGFFEEATTLYSEYLPKRVDKNNMLDKFNQASALLQSKNLEQGLDISNQLYDLLEKSENEEDKKLFDLVKQNILTALKQGQGQGEGENKQEEQEGDKKDQNKDQKSDGKSGKDKKDKKDEKDKDKGDESEKKDNQDQKDGQDQKEQDQQKNKQSNNQEKKDIPKQKIPVILKQLMSDDSQLQKKLIDAETVERKIRDKKDW